MENKKLILGLVGEIASGKGSIVKYLEKRYSATSNRFSTTLRNVLDRMYVDVNRKNMQTLSLILRQSFGENLLAKIISKDAMNDDNPIVVVDGIRRPADIEFLSVLPEFKLAYVTTDMKTRYERIINRDENKDDAAKTFEEFEQDHKAETELEIPNIGKKAQIKIDNTGDFEGLYEQVDKIIN